jgi:pimeloyl-ACP methyl ester carboxylesterase
MSTYERDGLRLYYDIFGDGPSILCVHGATGTGRYEWARLTETLGGRYRFIVPDLRGHGRSDHRAGAVGIEHVNDDLLGLLAHEGIVRPHVLAFSFGAEAALDLELTHPGTAASLILVSPGLGDPKSSVPTRAQLEAGWPRSLRQLHVDQHGEDHWLGVMLELCDRAARRPKADLAALAAIECPVLLIVGSNDDPRRIRHAQVFEGAHDRCQLIVVDDGRHAVHRERAADVARAIASFLDGVSAHDRAP